MRVAFFGTPDFAAASLEALLASRHQVVAVVAQPDRPAGRGMKLHKPPVAVVAEREGIPLLQPAKIRNEDFLAAFKSFGADIAAVVAYGRILPKQLLDASPHGFLNVHGSILPKYRGAAPIQRAIENGETETGVSIMRLDEDLDHGPVYSIVRTPLGADERAPELFSRLAEIGGYTLVSVLDAIESGAASAAEQDHAAATFAPKIEKEESDVVWTMSAKSIYDRFRAFDPWPGIRAMVAGEPVKLLDVRPVFEAHGSPGVVVAVDRDSFTVACGSGGLRVLAAQRPGKPRVGGGDYARGARLAVGARLA
ncbi:MAG: methionyl-tRNA formyltransferase [Thermoanaerobaculia bacterium]|nr:methionyl-tRNA formyltransferase [Thermoanaerobaculia bacterium]